MIANEKRIADPNARTNNNISSKNLSIGVYCFLNKIKKTLNSSKFLKKVIHSYSKYWKYSIITLLFSISSNYSLAQAYWQQKVAYDIAIDFDVKTHQFTGNLILKYYNNSPDTLYKVFYHLYFNAFQPLSAMDVRNRTISDPHPNIKDRILHLKPNEIGYHHIESLKQDGRQLAFNIEGTILEVTLTTPIPPNSSTTFDMKFESQVPVQIRRSGRNNQEGVDYSMSQWFPKIAEYDKKGWHAHPYVGREFYAPWGNYNVSISIDSNYVLGGTGVIKNPDEVGYGYGSTKSPSSLSNKLTWEFEAINVHDFVWAADRDYQHVARQVEDGPLLHFLYQSSEDSAKWATAINYTQKAFPYIQETFGKYPYKQFSVIQGGDGGMEYPMVTLVTSGRSVSGLVGVIIHELMHQWYYGLMANNESYASWMDEGFTEFAETYTKAFIYKAKEWDNEFFNPIAGSYISYNKWIESGLEEPMSTHSDHFATNNAYVIAAYTKGKITLQQLMYVIGQENLYNGLLDYYQEWKFKHPDPNDFIRVMEKQSGIELDWYLDYWVNSTHTIDYAVSKVSRSSKDSTNITLSRKGRMPMPIDLWVTKKDGERILYYIPMNLMRGEKPNDFEVERIIIKDWAWTHPEYSFDIPIPIKEIKKVEIDASGWMADVDKDNNIYQK